MLLLTVAAALATEAPPVPLSLLTAKAASGDRFDVALRFDVPAGWHLYWTNPGQSGLPTTVRLEAAGAVGAAEFPTPARFENSGIVNYGYGEPFSVLFSVAAAEGTALSAAADWLMCRGDVCVTGAGSAKGTLLASGTASRSELPRPFAEVGRTRWHAGMFVVLGPPGGELFPSLALESVWQPTPAGAEWFGPLPCAPAGAYLVVASGSGAARRGYLLQLDSQSGVPQCSAP